MRYVFNINENIIDYLRNFTYYFLYNINIGNNIVYF